MIRFGFQPKVLLVRSLPTPFGEVLGLVSGDKGKRHFSIIFQARDSVSEKPRKFVILTFCELIRSNFDLTPKFK